MTRWYVFRTWQVAFALAALASLTACTGMINTKALVTSPELSGMALYESDETDPAAYSDDSSRVYYVRSSKVRFEFTSSAASEVLITDKQDCDALASEWKSYSKQADYDIIGLTPDTQGRRSVYVQLRSSTFSNSSCYKIQIVLDQIAPEITTNLAASPVLSIQKTDLSLLNLSGNCSEKGRNVELLIEGPNDIVTETVPCTDSNLYNFAIDLVNDVDGVYNVSLRQTDLAGNITTLERSFDKSIGALSGAIQINSGATYTNSLTVALQLNSTDASEMYITNTLGCASDGTWESYATTKSGWQLKSAEQNSTAHAYAKFRNPSGWVSECFSTSIVHDNVAPSLSLSATPAANAWVSASTKTSFSVSGDCSAVGRSVVITGASTTTTSCVAGGHWSANLNFAGQSEGNITIHVNHSDAATNAATQVDRVYVLDTVAPVLTLDAPTNAINLANQGAYTLSGSCSGAQDGNTVTISGSPSGSVVNLGTTTCQSGAFSISTLNLSAFADGSVNLKANVSDAAGNPAIEVSRAYIKDTVIPVLAFTAPTSGINATNASAFSFAGTCSGMENGQTITIKKGTTVVASPTCSSAAWATSGIDFSTLPAGTVTLTATGTDSAGNPATAVSQSFLVDFTVPTISSVSINGGSTTAGGNVLPVAVVATDGAGSGIGAYRWGISSDLSSATWSSTAPTLYSFIFAPGTFTRTFYVQVKDLAGNLSAVANASISITLGRPPTVDIIKPDGSLTYTATGATVHISWKATLNSANALSSTGTVITYTTDNGLTLQNWSSTDATVGHSLSPGQNGSCTLDGDATGCMDLSLPAVLASAKFRVVVSIGDVSSNITSATSVVLNGTSGLSLFAGKNSGALGQTAASTALTANGSIARDPVTGDIYTFGGNKCYIMKISASTGIIDRWLGSPSNCSSAGDGQNISQIRFQSYSNVSGMVVDSNRNVYWAANWQIWKFDYATNTASIYINAGVAPVSSVEGTARRSFQTGGGITGIDLGYGGRLYFSVGGSSGSAVFKVEDDGTVVKVAGTLSAGAPSPTVGADARTVWVNSFSIKRGTSEATDRVFLSGGTACASSGSSCAGLWEVAADHTISQLSTNASIQTLGHYLYSRGQLPYSHNWGGGGLAVKFIDPDHPTTSIPVLTPDSQDFTWPDASTFYDIAEDDIGGFFYTTSLGTIIRYVDASNARVAYAGIVTDAGDGDLATEAQLRGPTSVSYDTSGNTLIYDSTNRKVRKVNSSGVISSLSSLSVDSNIHLPTGANASSWVVTQAKNVRSTSNTCVMFCGGSGLNLSTATSNASPATLNNNANGILLSFDGSSTYILMETRSATWNSFLKKIDNTGTLTEIGGNHAELASDSNFAITAGSAIMGNPVEWGWTEQFLVVNGVIYVKPATWRGSGYIYSVTESGTWVIQVARTITGFTVNPSDNKLYYTSGTVLYRKAYAAGGGGADTALLDFSGVLTSPKVVGFDPNLGHTLMITDGNSVYRYTDATNIP